MPACQEPDMRSQRAYLASRVDFAECSGRCACHGAPGAPAHPAGAGGASADWQRHSRACTTRWRFRTAHASLLAAVLLAAALPIAEPATRLVIRAKVRWGWSISPLVYAPDNFYSPHILKISGTPILL